MENCLIFGTGGHAKVVADILELSNQWHVLGFVSKPAEKAKNSLFLESPIVEQTKKILESTPNGIVAIGDGNLRREVSEQILKLCPSFNFISAIHPNAIVAKSAQISHGCVIAAGAIINSGSNIQRHCLINTGSIIEHDNELSAFVNIGPATATGGNVHIGLQSSTGIGTVINQNLRIGNYTILGSGSIVTRDIPCSVIAYGNPCAVIRKRQKEERYL